MKIRYLALKVAHSAPSLLEVEVGYHCLTKQLLVVVQQGSVIVLQLFYLLLEFLAFVGKVIHWSLQLQVFILNGL